MQSRVNQYEAIYNVVYTNSFKDLLAHIPMQFLHFLLINPSKQNI